MEPSRESFDHPYSPYDIQLQFMQCLYQSIEDRKVAIFESPTGTGKSLSLICGALTWLRDDARRQIEGSFAEQGDSDDDWLVAAEKVSRKRRFLQERDELERKLAAVRVKEAQTQKAQVEARANKKLRIGNGQTRSNQGDLDQFLLEDYHSDEEHSQPGGGTGALSSSTQALLEKLKPAVREDESEPEEDKTKIIFCSRTHSQLTQFINELRKVTLPSSVPQEVAQVGQDTEPEVIKHLALGSRKNLCINEKVRHLSSTLAINDRCIELQKAGTAKEHKCQYLPSKDDKAKVEAFRDRAIATIRDIEDMGKLGRKMDICPYYASRQAIAPSEILTLPYPLLLQKTAREALGIDIRNNVVIIDEAHNLMDAIAETLSSSLSLSSLDVATSQVIAYIQRYKNKLKGSNRAYVTQLIRVLNSFTNCLRNTPFTPERNEVAVTATDLMAGKGSDQVKPHKLLQYLVQSKLAHKVEGYTAAQEELAASTIQPKGGLMLFQQFLAIMMNPDAEGRFFVSKTEADMMVRYTLLDPRAHFRGVVEEARSVILAGGTMSPMSDYVDYLFSYLDPSRLSTFSFGHVIPKTNMLALAITKGLSGAEFEFTFERRRSQAMIVELGGILARICEVVPDGVVVFFPSYDYLAQVSTVWKQTFSGPSIMSTLSRFKAIFEETKGGPVDELLGEYSQSIDLGKGGLLLSVVGGKLSEGINFSDKLGRAVVAVGLPFPNMGSAEWKAKIEHVEHMTYEKSSEEGLSERQSRDLGKAAGRDFYENACMRAVNQSIGRAIRHKEDYAAIILIDRRFATERISNKLPQWIRSNLKDYVEAHSWTSKEAALSRFFLGKQT